MAFRILAEAVEEKLDSIASVLSKIEREGGGADLRDLRIHLIEAMTLFQRNPGIEAAVDDLYAAAVSLASDCKKARLPNSRKLRIVREAHDRLSGRLESAAERVGPYEHLVVPDFRTRRAA